MRRVYLAELRDSWSAWLGVSLAFVATNLSFVVSALVLSSGWAAIGAGKLVLEDSAEFTLTPITNFVFSGIVGLTVVATSATMVVDTRRGSLARLAVAGADPGQIVRSVMTQLVAVSLAFFSMLAPPTRRFTPGMRDATPLPALVRAEPKSPLKRWRMALPPWAMVPMGPRKVVASTAVSSRLRRKPAP